MRKEVVLTVLSPFRSPRSAGWLLCAAVTCTGCASRGPAVETPTPRSAAPEDSQEQAVADARLAALGTLRTKLERLLADVEKQLLDALGRPLPVASAVAAEPEPGVAVQSAAGATLPPPPDEQAERVEDLLDRRLVITVALVRIDQAVIHRRLELGLPIVRTSRPGAAGHARLGEPGGGAGAGGVVDLSTASVAAVLQDAELAIDDARRWRAEHGTDVSRMDQNVDRGLLAELKKEAPVRASDDDLRQAQAAPAPPLEDFLGGRGIGTGSIDGLTDEELEPEGGEWAEDRRDEAKPRPVARKRKAARSPVAKGDGWFGVDEPNSGESSRRASVVVQGAPPAGVMSAVQRRLGSMLDCIPAADRTSGPIRFRVTARLGGDGQLHEPVIRSGGALAPTIEACLVDQLVRVRAPAPEDGASRVVAFPVWLSAD
jgi:hypothetical protein